MKKWIYSGKAFVDEEMLKDVWVCVADGVIQAVEQHEYSWAPEEGEAIAKEASGVLIPGMIDTHVHLVHDGIPANDWETDAVLLRPGEFVLKALKNAQIQLKHGVLTVRDCGSRDLADICVRDSVKKGLFRGPRILATGHPITTTAGHMDDRMGIRPGIPYETLGYMGIIADCTDEARQCARRCILEGADYIKINVSSTENVRPLGGLMAPEMTFNMLKAVIDLAHMNMRRVTGHSHGGIAVDHAIEAGIDSLEHGRFISDEQFEKMAAKGIYLTPTLSPDARPPYVEGQRKPADEAWVKKAKSRMYEAVRSADAHGVKVTSGSDAGMAYIHHGEVAWEVEQLHLAGLSTKKSLLATTKYAAMNLGIDHLTGSIKEGLAADLLMLKKDPLEDLEVLKRWEEFIFIMKDGAFISKTV